MVSKSLLCSNFMIYYFNCLWVNFNFKKIIVAYVNLRGIQVFIIICLNEWAGASDEEFDITVTAQSTL